MAIQPVPGALKIALTGAELVDILAGPVKAVASVAQIGALGGSGAPMASTALNTVGAGTLLAAAINGRLITRGGAQAGAAFTDTTDTAANIIAAIPGVQVGQSFLLEMLNTTNAQQTIGPGAGVTLLGVQQISQNSRGTFLVTVTGATTVSMNGLSIVDRGIDNFNLTIDPGTAQDNTQGYGVGSIVFNTTAGLLRWWECRDASTGAAKWVFSGADYTNGGTNPSNEVTQFGLGAALMAEEGNINRQISAVGVQPGATGVDSVLAVYSLPANSFDVLGRGLFITGQGSFAANANSKRLKIIFNPATAVVGQTVGAGGTTVADTGALTTTANAGGWVLQANIFKYGAAGSNTQIGLHQLTQPAPATTPLAPSLITAVESGPILIAITGNAVTATTDITFSFLEVNAMN